MKREAEMTEVMKITRRQFVATSTAAAGGIVFGLPFPKMGPKFGPTTSLGTRSH